MCHTVHTRLPLPCLENQELVHTDPQFYIYINYVCIIIYGQLVDLPYLIIQLIRFRHREITSVGIGAKVEITLNGFQK